MFNRHRARMRWGREFDSVGRGLAEGQVFDEGDDLLERYGDLLEEQRYRDSLRELAESKVREAVDVARGIVEEARSKAAAASLESRLAVLVRSDAHASDPFGDAATGIGGLRPETTITIQPSDGDIAPPRVGDLIEEIETVGEISVKDFQWSPSSGWTIKVEGNGGAQLTPLLLGINGIDKIVEEADDGSILDRPPQPAPQDRLPNCRDVAQRNIMIWLTEDALSQTSRG